MFLVRLLPGSRVGSLGMALLLALVVSCGARSTLRSDEAHSAAGAPGAGGSTSASCTVDADCPTSNLCEPRGCRQGQCVAVPVRCPSPSSTCDVSECNPATGLCETRRVTDDQDGDGFFAVRPGFILGDPAACGNDCDDSSTAVFPGASELCNGVDDDCDGSVDEGAQYSIMPGQEQLVSEISGLQSSSGGITSDGSRFAISYGVQSSRWGTWFQSVDPAVASRGPEVSITATASDAFAGGIAWTGALFGTVWEDRRDNDYEIYFNRLDSNGQKLGPDLRITNADGFSLHPKILWTGEHLIASWDDERSGSFGIYGQILSETGERQGEDIQIIPSDLEAESPDIAINARGVVALVYKQGLVDRRIGMQLLDSSLTPLTDRFEVSSEGAVAPTVAAVGDVFLVGWHLRVGATPGDAIWGAVVSSEGEVLVPEQSLTSGASFARTHSLLSLGDRALLVWADDQSGSYDLYAKTLSATLDELTPRARITDHPADTTSPLAAVGPNGDIAIVFNDNRMSGWQSWLTVLRCSGAE